MFILIDNGPCWTALSHVSTINMEKGTLVCCLLYLMVVGSCHVLMTEVRLPTSV